jgi:hypothetical protein
MMFDNKTLHCPFQQWTTPGVFLVYDGVEPNSYKHRLSNIKRLGTIGEPL